MRAACKNRTGFTLVELTVVILIIAVLAAIAAPKFFDTLADAQDSAAVQDLTVIRDAIELYRANNTGYPGSDEATFKTALQDYIRGGFPSCPVGNKNDGVRVETADSSPLAVSGTEGWCYNNQTGEFRVNHADYITR